MTDRQKQCLLCYLGYYHGTIDGRWGPKSREAARAFQRSRGLPCDGVFGPVSCKEILTAVSEGNKEESFWDSIEFFRPEEFTCRCGRYCDGHPARMQEGVVRAADQVRRHFGAPATVSSGLRCPRHNREVGGVSNSRHLQGKAVDFCIRGKSAREVLAYVKTLPQIRYCYAINDRFIHMDIP